MRGEEGVELKGIAKGRYQEVRGEGGEKLKGMAAELEYQLRKGL